MPLMLIIAFFVHMSSVVAISSKKTLAELQFYSVHACQGISVVLGQQMKPLWFHKTVGGNVSLEMHLCSVYRHF